MKYLTLKVIKGNTTNFWIYLVQWQNCANWVVSFAVYSQMTVRRPFKFICHHNTPSLKPLRQHFGTGEHFLQAFFQQWCAAVHSRGSPVWSPQSSLCGGSLSAKLLLPRREILRTVRGTKWHSGITHHQQETPNHQDRHCFHHAIISSFPYAAKVNGQREIYWLVILRW